MPVKFFTPSVSGAASVSVSVKYTHVLPADVAGSSTVTATVRNSKRLIGVTVAGSSLVTTHLSHTKFFAPAATGRATVRWSRVVYGEAPVVGWEPPPGQDDFAYARLPFREAQRKLGEGGHVLGTRQLAVVGWHGDVFDPEIGSFVIAKTGTPFAELVGQRVWVSTRTGRRAVYAFVHSEADIFEDLSLTRRLFQSLELLAVDELDAFVEGAPKP